MAGSPTPAFRRLLTGREQIPAQGPLPTITRRSMREFLEISVQGFLGFAVEVVPWHTALCNHVVHQCVHIVPGPAHCWEDHIAQSSAERRRCGTRAWCSFKWCCWPAMPTRTTPAPGCLCGSNCWPTRYCSLAAHRAVAIPLRVGGALCCRWRYAEPAQSVGFPAGPRPNPIPSTLAVLFLYVALPFVVVATTAPLCKSGSPTPAIRPRRIRSSCYGASNSAACCR